MLTIEGQSNTYTLDLNDSNDSYRELLVNSSTSWIISQVSSEFISAYSFYGNSLGINADLKNIKKDCYIVLSNLAKERMIITVKPNIEMSRDKNYTFKLGKYAVSGNSITINVVSKENGKTEPWSIVTAGSPISYNISKLKTKLSLTLDMILGKEVKSLFEIVQDNSGKTIKFTLFHKDNDSVEIVGIKEAD